MDHGRTGKNKKEEMKKKRGVQITVRLFFQDETYYNVIGKIYGVHRQYEIIIMRELCSGKVKLL